MKNSFLSLLLCSFLLYACGGNAESSYDMASVQSVEATAPEMPTEKMETGEPTNVTIEKKLIKKGNLAFEVDDMVKTQQKLHELTKKYQGYIANESSNNYDYRLNNEIVIRFPNQHFDSFLADISTDVEHFDTKNIHVEDVTEEFLDVNSRIENKKKLEIRFNDILKKANSVAEILEIEKEINTLRTEIESLEGRLKYLTNQISYSTLTITYYKTINKTEYGIGNKFSQGFVNGWNNLLMFFVGLVNIWPFLIIISLVIFFIRRMILKRRNQQK